MPAKTSNGQRYRPSQQPNALIDPDGINASGGAVLEAERRLSLTSPTTVTFYRTGEKRNIHAGDLYILGAGAWECAYLATNAGDEYEIVGVKVKADE